MSRTGTFVVSGAGSGIGYAIAQKLIQNDHYVYALGRDLAKLERAQNALGIERFTFSSVDLASGPATHRAVKEIRSWLEEKHLPLLGLVNNAGVFDRIDFCLSDDALWERHFNNNLLSAVRLSRELYPELCKAQPSSILNISSTLGLRPIACTSAYSAIKAALISLTKSLALEWAADGIRVNCICPGIVDTPIHAFHSQDEPHLGRKQAHAAQPLGRMGHAEDIALASEFMLSPTSSWTTGSILNVDGGISL